MRLINRYLSNKIKASDIKATDETIHKIVKDELDRLGHNADLNHIDVSEVTDMNSLFSCWYNYLGQKYNDLNPNISRWNVGNAINMGYMFYDCKKFNQDISNWDVSNVKDMSSMFYGCENFNQDLSHWYVIKVKYHINMFKDCTIKEEFKPKFS